MKIGIVGSGNGGLMTALMLRAAFDFEIDIIFSKNIEIIGVGESTTETLSDFFEFTNIDIKEVIQECDAVYKCGMLFKGWSSDNFLYNIDESFLLKYGSRNVLYEKLISDKAPSLSPPYFINNKVPLEYLNIIAFNQLNFNTFKLNQYLLNKCKCRNINLIEDKIENVVISNNKIKYLQGEKNNHIYDFYIDCTGQSRSIISKLTSDWISYEDELLNNSALVLPTEQKNDIDLFVTSEVMDCGWRFELPAYDHIGNGYVYSDNHIDEEHALQELLNKLNYKKINNYRNIKFKLGVLRESWVSNCCAVGMSSGFLEPLHASAISASIKQTTLLINNIINYNQKNIDQYNKNSIYLYNNIKDFLRIHYINNIKNNKYWLDAENCHIDEGLKDKLHIWENRLPLQEDFSNFNYSTIFSEFNYISALYFKKLLNIDSIQDLYNSLPSRIKNETRLYEINLFNNFINKKLVSHKEYIDYIRNN